MQEKIPQRQQYKNEKTRQEHSINIQLICETSLDNSTTTSLKEDERIEIVLSLKSIHLQWLNIRTIQNLQVFSHLNILYLQHNKISTIQNLETLINLEYLALNDNIISKAQNLQGLKKLLGLNLNNNQIDEIDYKGLPPKVQLISFKSNPVCLDSGYKTAILKNLKDIEMLDDQNITPEDKFKSLGIFPQHLLDYASKMKHFRSKRQIKAQIQQEENRNKPILLGGIINEKQALGEMRAKTRKYLHESQETFKQQLQSQSENFQEKIQVSRRIREIKESQQRKQESRLKNIDQEGFEGGEETEGTEGAKGEKV